jgi:hypothetical protein
MAAIVGRGVRVEIAKTYGTPVAVSGVTNAKPGVAASVGHSLAAKSVGYFSGVEGMVPLEGQAARANPVATDTFTAEDINTTDFGTFTDAATFTPVTAWATISNSTRYAIGGGDADKLDATTLLDNFKQEIPGYLGAQSVTIDVLSEDAASEGMALVEDAARNARYEVFRITLKTGATRVFRGQPSMPGEDVAKGALGTGSFGIAVKGFVTRGAA